MNPADSGRWPKAGVARGERRKRTIYTKEQVAYLTKAFEEHPYPGYETRKRLARRVGIPEPRIHVWFQNRRARQPKLSNHEESGRQEDCADPADPNQAAGGGDFSPIPGQLGCDDTRLPGSNWTVLGHPGTFQPLGCSQEGAPFPSQNSLSVRPTIPSLHSFVDWDPSIPSGSGHLPAFPQLNQPRHLAQDPLQLHCYDPYQQQPSQNPQLADHFYSPPHCLYSDPAVDLLSMPDIIGPPCPTPAAPNEVQMPQTGLYGSLGSSVCMSGYRSQLAV